jgi:hypothetical protein
MGTHTLLVPGLSNRPGQPRLLARKAHLAAATNRLAQCLPCLQRIRALCTKHSHPAGSWGLRRHRPRARTRSDQTRCGTRLVSASALPWQEPHAGAGDGNDASQWRRRMLPTIWGYSGSFSPCRFVETPNVTAPAWTQARTPCTSSSPHSLYGEMLSGESTAQPSENSSDAAEDAASLATLPTSP